jgi:aminoglycoside phosphotransferase family enzyme/predicted kinase
MIDATTSQDEVFAFLGRSSTHGGAAVHRIDTHAAVIFLAGSRAFKVKRAVRFPFLDYSTLDKRKLACDAEIEVNCRFAPDLYRGVVAITRKADSQLFLGGAGQPIEWAVEMRRFDEKMTLDQLADQGALDLALADSLGRIIATAHARAPVVAAEPWIDAIATYIEQNDAAFRKFGELFDILAIGQLTRQSRLVLSRIRPLLIARGELGLVRRGHGDLHLGNIALIDGRPIPFDAIEFDPLIASGDVLYDLAFLLMDLIERNLRSAANVVFNRYLTETHRTEDIDALAALPLFLSMRAAIRAKVTAARLAYANDAERPAIITAARTYFRLATQLIASPPPALMAIGGLSGTGKSVLAGALAPDLLPEPGALVLRSDVQRKVLFGVSETDRLPADAYTAEVTSRVYGSLADKARRAIIAGHSAIVDAVFAQPDERTMIARVASEVQAVFRGIFLSADLATRISRISTRANDASDADIAIAQQQQSYALGNMNWSVIDATGTTPRTLALVESALN